jgi:hypothetical protein
MNTGMVIFVGFEVLTPVGMKSSGFWDTTPLLSTRFHAGFLLGLFFDT